MFPLVSIIIPAYNSEKYLAEAIQSAIVQTYENTEIIIVDDGSFDNSYAIAKRYESNKVKVYRQKNSGASAARNFGFLQSSGKYIQFLDSDDILESSKIENQIILLSQLPENYISSCSWLWFHETISDGKFEMQKVMTDSDPVGWLTLVWTGGGMMQTACWLTPRILIEKAGLWNETLSLNDDAEFFCRVILHSEGIKYCASSMVYYRKHEGQRISTTKNMKSITSLLNSYIAYEENVLRFDSSVHVKYSLAMNYTEFIYQYYNLAPDLAAVAEMKIDNLGVKKFPSVGGRRFKVISKIIGFKNLLRTRYFFKKR